MFDQLTIALPVYKRTDFIRQALDSAVNQITVACKILLIDNSPTTISDHRGVTTTRTSPTSKPRETVPQDAFQQLFPVCRHQMGDRPARRRHAAPQYVEFCQKIFATHGEQAGGIILNAI
ncbi:MAG: hypothetical protein R2751_16070 [Bacteroidales bacterium]